MFEYWMHTDLTGLPEVNRIQGHGFTKDDGANRIGVIITQAGEPAELEGSVSANIILPDKTTISVSGSMEGNRVWVALPDEAYDLAGKIRIFLKITGENSTVTVGAAEGNVYQSMTSEVI